MDITNGTATDPHHRDCPQRTGGACMCGLTFTAEDLAQWADRWVRVNREMVAHSRAGKYIPSSRDLILSAVPAARHVEIMAFQLRRLPEAEAELVTLRQRLATAEREWREVDDTRLLLEVDNANLQMELTEAQQTIARLRRIMTARTLSTQEPATMSNTTTTYTCWNCGEQAPHGQPHACDTEDIEPPPEVREAWEADNHARAKEFGE